MEKHLLVTVSEQKSALCGVRFVGEVFTKKDEVRLTLFYTAPRPPSVWEGERTLESVSQAEQIGKDYEAKGRRALNGAKRELVQQGFDPERIQTKLLVRRLSKVMEIIQEAEKGLYDAVVLGRRGVSWLEAAFDESVSKEMMESEFNSPLWICRRPGTGRRHVLLCVDGSEAALRAADHVGFILGPSSTHEVHLMTVRRPGSASGTKPEDVFSEARKHILANGFPKGLIREKLIDSGNVAKTILRETEAGRFVAVAVGRTGAGQGLFRRLFLGSASMTLFKELEQAGLWVCK